MKSFSFSPNLLLIASLVLLTVLCGVTLTSAQTPTALFDSVTVELTKRGESQGLINRRDFTIKALNSQFILNESMTFRFDAPIVQSDPNAEITCANGNNQLPSVINPDKTGFSITFEGHNLPVGTNLQITCGRYGQGTPEPTVWFDFTPKLNQIVTLTVKMGDSRPRSLAQIGPINDPEPTDVSWPFKFDIPLRTANQPFITLVVQDIPTFAQSKTNKYNMIVTFTGLEVRNTPSVHNKDIASLHYLTQSSYHPNMVDPIKTGFSIASITSQSPLTIPLTFPKDDDRWDVSLQVATHSLEGQVTVTVAFETSDLPIKKTYRPDKTTVTSWGYATTPTSSPLEIKFGKYIGHVAKKDHVSERGPTFDITFPHTTTPLVNSIFSLTTNSSLVGIENAKAFYIDPFKKDAHKCHIREFKHDVHAELDFYGQTVHFNFTGIEQLRESGKSFTLSCPDLAVIPVPLTDEAKKAKKPVNVPISFVLHGSDSLHQAFASSIVAIPPNDPGTKRGYGGIIVFIIVVILLGIAGFIGWKKYQERKNSAQNNQVRVNYNDDTLIGEYQAPIAGN